MKDRMRRGVKFTTCLAHTFVECLKKRTATKLQVLDMTGYPTGKTLWAAVMLDILLKLTLNLNPIKSRLPITDFLAA